MRNKHQRFPIALSIGLGVACAHAEKAGPVAPTAARTLYLHVEGMKKAKGGAT